jgi:hypothetical protein
MGYLIKAPLGLGLFLGGLVLFNVKLVSLLETGTCASGNTPYQISQPCPSGTGTDILLLMASIFGGLIGVGLFAVRGNPPWDSDRKFDLKSDFSWPAFAWGMGFTVTGATSLIAGLTDEAVKNASGAQLGALIVGGIFLVMGLPIFVLSIWWLLKDFRRRRGPASLSATPTTTTASSAGSLGSSSGFASAQQWTRNLPWVSGGGGGGGTGGQIAKLERLQRLRESGALTEAEFEREKAKVLSE